jgi:hypothetical protein
VELVFQDRVTLVAHNQIHPMHPHTVVAVAVAKDQSGVQQEEQQGMVVQALHLQLQVLL